MMVLVFTAAIAYVPTTHTVVVEVKNKLAPFQLEKEFVEEKLG